jgi:hypothetical protein
MDIGQPKRIIEIAPASLPVPGEIAPDEPSPGAPQREEPQRAEPAEPEPSTPADRGTRG